MARKTNSTHSENGVYWFKLATAASLLGTLPRKLAERVLAGEFRFKDYDALGFPRWIAEPDVTAARATITAAKRDKAMSAKSRQKTPKQQEAEWARISSAMAKPPRDGPFVEAHLRLTLLDPKKHKRPS
jgi:hypothetical protein